MRTYSNYSNIDCLGKNITKKKYIRYIRTKFRQQNPPHKRTRGLNKVHLKEVIVKLLLSLE
jgi:hypothetical protein